MAWTAVEEFWDSSQDEIYRWLANLGIALAIVIVGVVVINRLHALVDKVFLDRQHGLDKTLSTFLSSAVRAGLRFLLFVIVMAQLGVDSTSFIAVAGGVAFALAFALQGVMSNFAAGLMLLSVRQFGVGDMVELDGCRGKVIRIAIFNTAVLTVDERVVIIPNAKIIESNIINYCERPVTRIHLPLGVEYGQNIEVVRKLVHGCMWNHVNVLFEPEPRVVFDNFGESSLDLIAICWIDTRNIDYWNTRWQLLEAINDAFVACDITVPFPQRDVHLDGVLPQLQPQPENMRVMQSPPSKSGSTSNPTIVPTTNSYERPANSPNNNHPLMAEKPLYDPEHNPRLDAVYQRLRNLTEVDRRSRKEIQRDKKKEKEREKGTGAAGHGHGFKFFGFGHKKETAHSEIREEKKEQAIDMQPPLPEVPTDTTSVLIPQQPKKSARNRGRAAPKGFTPKAFSPKPLSSGQTDSKSVASPSSRKSNLSRGKSKTPLLSPSPVCSPKVGSTATGAFVVD